MKYRLKELCSITKGATGIMKADGGKYPLVALSDERRNHSEFQFDAKAVIVPLISSTGHGHASMKRVHYQEGKFALGNILCAVIPNDETQLNAKYLHLYLQQFKETLLVPLMKGAANVSLPMNKLADIEIEVPSFERQLEIIELEDEAAEYKNELEEKLILQNGDVTKLRQALLREAMQGKLTKQNVKDGNATDLLKNVKAKKEKLKKEKSIQSINEEEFPFDIPENWVWVALGEIAVLNARIGWKGLSASEYKNEGPLFLSVHSLNYGDYVDYSKAFHVSQQRYDESPEIMLQDNDILICKDGAGIGKLGIVRGLKEQATTNSSLLVIRCSKILNVKFVYYYLVSDHFQKIVNSKIMGGTTPHLYQRDLVNFSVALPPIPEQNRIVKKIEQLMQLCDELQYSIQQSKIENEKLLQGALRDALKKEEMVTA